MKDLFGKAILDFQTNNSPEDLITETNISEADEMSVDYLFRSFNEMPKLEKKALQLCKGKVLDVGCGAGSHSLYLQQQSKEVISIDISEKAIQACRLRGVAHPLKMDVMESGIPITVIFSMAKHMSLCHEGSQQPPSGFPTRLGGHASSGQDRDSWRPSQLGP